MHRIQYSKMHKEYDKMQEATYNRSEDIQCVERSLGMDSGHHCSIMAVQDGKESYKEKNIGFVCLD